MHQIPFNKAYITGRETKYIAEAHALGHLSGDGEFTSKCHAWLREATRAASCLLTHSCTAALEMAAILAEIQPGDEIIMPSYTFVSTANAFVLRGGVPVFVDCRADTLNIDETLIESAITPRTKAIVPVHYAGVACEMDTILAIANKNDLLVIEDAAQGVMAAYKGRPLGAIGDFGTYSFHETKNIVSGEGGALVINSLRHLRRAEIIREKGTNRSQFFRGQVDKYSWVDIGSSYLPGEVIAAFLWAQLEEARSITERRLAIWRTYHDKLASLEAEGLLRRPIVPKDCQHNAHMYYVVVGSPQIRTAVMAAMKNDGIGVVFHYVPLHQAPAAKLHARVSGKLPRTEWVAERILRLPLWLGMEGQVTRIVDALTGALLTASKRSG